MQHSDTKYFQGYHYGLRRHYHDDNFGDNKIIEIMKNRGGLIADGISFINALRFGAYLWRIL